MFSNKEYLLVFGGGMIIGIMYMICRLSAAIDDRAAFMVGGILILMQLIPFFLYMALLVIHIAMLYLSKKFMDHSVEGDFKKTFQLLNYSEVITILSLFWVLLLGVDFPTLYETWVKNPADAIKISFFPYWFYVTFLQYGVETFNYQFSILWFFPLTIFSAIFEIYTYGKYYKARHRFTHMYPSVAGPDFYNAFISKRRKERHTMIIPKDNLEEIEVPPCGTLAPTEKSKADPSSPLGKNLGNNSLYVVDAELLNKRRNTFKTQAEIDAEEDGFFSGAADKELLEYVNEAAENKASQEEDNINLDLDIRKAPDKELMQFLEGGDTGTAPTVPVEHGQAGKGDELNVCPECGYLNFEGNTECDFCGAALKNPREDI